MVKHFAGGPDHLHVQLPVRPTTVVLRQTELWAKIPRVHREQATFHTDQCEAYAGVIPVERYRAITKKAHKTHHIERFNNILRQRVSRLVREPLSFSKKLAHHIGAIKHFICHCNLTRTTALAV
jgi:insertion element IS1 protein InsB